MAKQLASLLAILMGAVALGPCYAGGESATESAHSVAEAFATSPWLGSGEIRRVAKVVVEGSTATATIDTQDDLGYHPKAYTARLWVIGGRWRVVSVEYVFLPTGEFMKQSVDPPFPHPKWDKVFRESD